jgi:hypothetical protein
MFSADASRYERSIPKIEPTKQQGDLLYKRLERP